MRRKQIDDLRGKLRQWMVRVNDSALRAFDNRHQRDALEAFMESYREQAEKEVEALRLYEKANNYRF